MKKLDPSDKRTPGTFPVWIGYAMTLIGFLAARPFINAATNKYQDFEQAASIIALFALAITVLLVFKAIDDLKNDYKNEKQKSFEYMEKIRELGQKVDVQSNEIYRLRSLID